ncbi:MAG: DUF2236 domain-containing protein [Lewinellaceae bacterium]|nr:DUF2236 domain-containing protein [Saprospiraceae bacterium]MCB9333396.1 DUF2236 domain-containing protein [Lewinellaceae bacterium]
MEQNVLNREDSEPKWELSVATIPNRHSRYGIRDYILTLDPKQDCQEISYLFTCYEFPWDVTRSLEFALFRVFGVAKGTPLLASTGEFLQRTQKRYDDTVLILSEILENGYDRPRGQAALVRMNKQHGRFQIPNDEYVYTLSTFILEPARWIDRYGWRKVTETEKQAAFFFWTELGRRMGIRDMPESYVAFDAFNRAYEQEQFRYAPENELIAVATRNLMLSWVLPKPLFSLGAPFVHALIDDQLLQAVGMRRAPVWLQTLVRRSVRLRGQLVRMLPPRKKPHLLTRLPNRTYSKGYAIPDLGAKP